jgi:arylformamidase
MKKIYDISVTLGLENITYPGDTPFTRDWDLRMANADACNLSRLALSAHSGTHMDFPLHFIDGGKSAVDYPVDRFIMPAQVIEIADRERITAKELAAAGIRKRHALLFKTRNSREGLIVSGKYTPDFVALDPDACELIIANGSPMVGIDYITIEKSADGSHPVHQSLLGHDIFILESINLAHIKPGIYSLSCLPLRIHGCEGSPVRAVLQ